MSKPDWTALAARYGAQEASYNAPDDDLRPCARCSGLIPPEMHLCDGCAADWAAEHQSVLAACERDAGAAEDSQATVALALALGTCLAFVVAALVLALCVYGAAWIDGAWLAPFAGLVR